MNKANTMSESTARLHLLLGPVGAGKSTLARQLSREHRAIALILDDWMARLYGPDERPPTGRIAWYLERRDRCLARGVADIVVVGLVLVGRIRRQLEMGRERAVTEDATTEADTERQHDFEAMPP